jgi:hypothetical protein
VGLGGEPLLFEDAGVTRLGGVIEAGKGGDPDGEKDEDAYQGPEKPPASRARLGRL